MKQETVENKEWVQSEQHNNTKLSHTNFVYIESNKKGKTRQSQTYTYIDY